jgi:hypothetical protein
MVSSPLRISRTCDIVCTVPPTPVLKFRFRTVKGIDWHPIHEPDQSFTDGWLEQSIDSNWTACFRLAIQNGQPIISELRVFPTEHDPESGFDAGEWRVEQEGPLAPVPEGGIGSQLVRRIPFAALDSLPDIVGWVASNSPSSMPTLAEVGLEVGVRTKRPGPKGHSDTDLALMAFRYWKLVMSGDTRPNKRLAAEDNVSSDAIRDRIQAARDRGLLTHPSKPGKPGGRLTPRAVELVRTRIKGA